MPGAISPVRSALLDELAALVSAIRPGRTRIVVDGLTGSGKTTFANELGTAIRNLDRPTLRATFDDFKKPWRDARDRGYDRVSGEGYYRNAPDFDSAIDMLIEPAGPAGSGVVSLCAHDPLTGADLRHVTIEAPPTAVLIVDSVFGMRPEYDSYWDLRIWLEVPVAVALARGVERDAETEGRAEAERLHRERYHAAERIYLEEVDPRRRADVIVDNSDLGSPMLLRP